MSTFVLLSKLPPELTHGGGALRKATEQVRARIKEAVPNVKWHTSLAVFGRYDVLDIFDAPDAVAAARIATIVRDAGGETETWTAVPFEELLKMTD